MSAQGFAFVSPRIRALFSFPVKDSSTCNDFVYDNSLARSLPGIVIAFQKGG